VLVLVGAAAGVGGGWLPRVGADPPGNPGPGSLSLDFGFPVAGVERADWFPRAVIRGNKKPVPGGAFWAAGRAPALGHQSHPDPPWAVRVCEAADARFRSAISAADAVGSLDFSPDGKELAVVTHDGSVRVANAATGKDRAVLDARDAVAAAFF